MTRRQDQSLRAGQGVAHHRPRCTIIGTSKRYAPYQCIPSADLGWTDPPPSAILRSMFDPASLDELSKRLADALPGGLMQIRDEIQKNFRAILQGTLSQMNLVSREEFDVQREVLARTRAKLEALEAQIAELEKQLLKS